MCIYEAQPSGSFSVRIGWGVDLGLLQEHYSNLIPLGHLSQGVARVAQPLKLTLLSQVPSGQRATLFKNSKGNSETVCQRASLDTWITCLLAQWELASPISLRLGPMIDSLPRAPGKAFRRWAHQLGDCQPHVFMHLQIPG